MKIFALQGDSVDEICFRHYGRTRQVVEQVYAANSGLAEQGACLPHGYPLELPDLPRSATHETLNLWS
ncbi:tail protein X [Erwinia sp. V90_4]|uniref:tail protein X n=1 Tax=Erwinia sp. V90_4 TaxID=3044239 RepID=UPI00249E65F9|nr:tail protein X [Erwinia sp. V90_4]MDI3442283.1 tail protein X [Erwinia sp. V90_4]